MNDSGMYVGACLQVCDVTIDHAWMENNALGYSGTNSGGAVVIENSQFDNNEDGVDTNTQIAGDPPPPQNGACPNGGTSPITHTHSCWVFIHNNVHDNNNGDVPQAGNAAAGPDRDGHDALGRAQRHRDGQHVRQQRRLGDAVHPVPRHGHTVAAPEVRATTAASRSAASDASSRPRTTELEGNTYVHDGFFGNPTNADFGQIVLHSGLPSQLLRRQHAPQGSAPPNLEQLQPTCGVPSKTDQPRQGALVTQVECDSGLACLPGRGRTIRRSRACISSRCHEACRRWPTRAPACRRTRGAPPASSLGSTTRHGGHGAPAAPAPGRGRHGLSEGVALTVTSGAGDDTRPASERHAFPRTGPPRRPGA